MPELTFQLKDSGVDIVATLDLRATYPKAKALLDARVLKHVIVERFRDMLPGVKGVLFGALQA